MSWTSRERMRTRDGGYEGLRSSPVSVNLCRQNKNE